MTLSEAIEVQQHLINSYSSGKKINLFGMGEFMSAQYQKYVDSCTIAITLMRDAENRKQFADTDLAQTIASIRIFENQMKKAEAAGDKKEVKKITAINTVAKMHKLTFTELCNIINELAVLEEGSNE